MILPDKCPKCGSKMYPDKDEFGPYYQCLTCSFILDIEEKKEVTNASSGLVWEM